MRLFYLSALSFLFIASSTLAISNFNFSKPKSVSKAILGEKVKKFTPIPLLVDESSFPSISAQAALAIDLPSGVVLFEKNPDKKLLPASTTKIVTALVAMDFYHPDEILTVGKEILVDGQKMSLAIGEKIKVRDLLYGLLVYSANDAAEVLAKNYPGGREAFVYAMNLKAKELYMDNSFFSNPSGLDSVDQLTSARDLVRVSSVAMQNPLFRNIVATKKVTVKSVDGRFSHRLFNINELLGEVDGVLGVKTGWTPNSQENLVTYIEKDDRKIMIALLGSKDRFGETKKLIDWIFTSFRWQDL